MNASLQCVSNTQTLTQYFAANMHLLELNRYACATSAILYFHISFHIIHLSHCSRDNPLGMKGNIAKDYGDLVRDIWKGKSRTIAPLRLRVR